ncbi:hypothetical protein [Blastococcus capsensis]|uniref:hypothetical protein n=1 Tax=Blastococcus capsensis TaxID=1564163 RepID=UPI0025419B3B|nr:hypothetical protein [Blastococcus capsensis]MDK3255955.1 hypothetical protein [Blastococcus capsensis]
MRKSSGDKRKYLDDAHIDEVTRLYSDVLELADADERVKVIDDDTFGFRRITVERPLRRRWTVTQKTVEAVRAARSAFRRRSRRRCWARPRWPTRRRRW